MGTPSAGEVRAARKRAKEIDEEEDGLGSTEAADEVRRVFLFGLPHPCMTMLPAKHRSHQVRHLQHAQSDNIAPVSQARARRAANGRRLFFVLESRSFMNKVEVFFGIGVELFFIPILNLFIMLSM